MSASDISKEPVVDWGIRLFFTGVAFGLALVGTGTLVVEKLNTGTITTTQFLPAPFALFFFLYSANRIIQKLKKVSLP